MTPEPVRFGVIGCGGWARNVHLPNLRLLPDATVCALSSRTGKNLRLAADLCSGQPARYSDWRELLADESVEAVIICTSNQTHADLAVAALNAGKHVLVEKPLATTVADGNRVVTAAAESPGLLQVGLELRYSDLFTDVFHRLQRGDLGQPRMLWTQLFRRPLMPKGWRKQPEAGGPFLELGIHYLDLMTWLVGSSPVSVFSSGGSRRAGEPLDAVFTTVQYADGSRGSLAICLFSPRGPECRVGLLSEQGRLTVELDSRTLEFWPTAGEGEEPLRDRIPAPDHPLHGFDGTYQQLAAFCTSVRTGTKPLADVSVGYESLCTALAAAESAETGVPVGLGHGSQKLFRLRKDGCPGRRI